MAVEHILATSCVLAWAQQFCTVAVRGFGYAVSRGKISSCHQDRCWGRCERDGDHMVRGEVWKARAERHEYSELKNGLWPEPAQVVLGKRKQVTRRTQKHNVCPSRGQ